MQNYLTADNLTVGYRGKPILSDISMNIRRGFHRHADRTERGWKIHDLKEHHPGTFPIRRKCIS